MIYSLMNKIKRICLKCFTAKNVSALKSIDFHTVMRIDSLAMPTLTESGIYRFFRNSQLAVQGRICRSCPEIKSPVSFCT